MSEPAPAQPAQDNETQANPNQENENVEKDQLSQLKDQNLNSSLNQANENNENDVISSQSQVEEPNESQQPQANNNADIEAENLRIELEKQEKFKQGVNSIVKKLTYVALVFNSSVTYYFYRKVVLLSNQRNKCLSDEKFGREVIRQLKENSLCYFKDAEYGDLVFVSGKVNSESVSAYLSQSQVNQSSLFPTNSKDTSKVVDKITGDKGENIEAHFYSSTQIKKISPVDDQKIQLGLQTRITAFVLSLFSLDIFKTSINVEPSKQFLSISHFFFGQKIASSDGQRDFLHVNKVFEDFNFRQLWNEQTALKISAILAGIAGVYFGIKAIRNVTTIMSSEAPQQNQE